MAISNRDRVGRGFELLAAGLEGFIDSHMHRVDGSGWVERFVRQGPTAGGAYSTSDPSFQLLVLTARWDDVFRSQLPRSMRSLIFELRDTRNKWAHNAAFSPSDAYRALDSIRLLLEAVDAHEADDIRAAQDDLGRVIYERARSKEESASSNVVDAPTKGLQAWRKVILPHDDVAAGRFNVAEFAADLELVRLRDPETATEYREPIPFFERTYLTAGLRDLLRDALRRTSKRGGQPIINCQTNFGGGKTHSLIALYHLFSGIQPTELPDEVRDLVEAEVDSIPAVHRAVVVGNRFEARGSEKSDGTKVNTIWGEIAWQLGESAGSGPEGYAIVAESDRLRTNPGDSIRQLFQRYSPCLVLIDEWVAYARELYGRDDLPGGSFDTQFGFAQALTEAARAVDGVFLVVSIPASESADAAPEAAISDLEVGGVGGREALRKLTTVVSRQAEHWQPARGDESFEIVRRRLFQPLDPELEAERDETAESFGELYRRQRAEFPAECAEHRYVERIKAAYPVHPEVFDRLYREWSTVERFQRTRGVLRLMAAVIHALWASDDQSPLILPCSIPLDDPLVNSELTSKLDDHWRPVIDADVDGPTSRPAQIDRDVPNLGRVHATRRVARTIFVGAAPTLRSANRGLEVARIRLGSCFPNDAVALFGDALNRLSDQAPHLYVDRSRYWFDLQENVNRTARDDADRLLSGNKDEVHSEVVDRLRNQRGTGDFRRVHPAPRSGDDVADDPWVRLVILGPETPHISKAEESPALQASRNILDRRGSVPRQYRNMLVFAAADQRRLEDLERATAEYLAWSGILDRREELNLDAHQLKQAQTMAQRANEAIELRIAETYQWVLVPQQPEPVGDVRIEEIRLDSQGAVAQRASRKLISEGLLAVQYPAQMLRSKLDRELASLWADGHVTIANLWDTFAKYVYLPRLRDIEVLTGAVEAAPALLTWQTDGFATAYGIEGGRYLGLSTSSHPGRLEPTALIVNPAFALGQLEQEPKGAEGPAGDEDNGHEPREEDVEPDRPPTRFIGRVSLDSARPSRDFGRVAQEVIEHLTALVDCDVEIVVEIVASKTDGLPEPVVRTVMENARTLKFDRQDLD
ncbi:MAG: Swt1 family HEPN domain-containing protein [Acidimicrobiia bacterium]|jgi:predicted AAA+ superfamily ATPase